MDMFSGLFGGSSSLVDGAKLVLVGGTIETARRVGSSAWNSFLSSFYLTAHFNEDDYPWDWLQYWLQRQPQWRSSREFETTTRTTTVGLGSKSNDPLDEFTDEQADPNDELTPGKQKMQVMFVPTIDQTIGILYRNHWLRIRRWRKSAPANGDSGSTGQECLSISVVARNNRVLKQLILEAKKMYDADAEHRVNIYFADNNQCWRWTDSRTKRPLSSIVLDPGVKENLLEDARDFLRSEKWYATRGIPFRRGYLLYGVPGAGKTSLIHALAGALSLDIYALSLSANWINDASLNNLMQRVPARCIILFEDLDAAFTRSSNREDDMTGVGSLFSSNSSDYDDDEWGTFGSRNSRYNESGSYGRRMGTTTNYNSLSLSGLLNSLDGVSAPEGRLLFATTNHIEKLDPALTRPGRMDVWVEFKHASQRQAQQLYKNFFSEVEEERQARLAAQPTPEQVAEMKQQFAALDAHQQEKAADSPPPSTPKEKLVPLNGPIPSNTAGAEAMAAAVEAEEAKKDVEDVPFVPPPLLERTASQALSPERIEQLAKEFAAQIPEGEFSVASLQGYLLRNKTRAEPAVLEATQWVQRERALRTKLEREKREREERLKTDAESRKKEAMEAQQKAQREMLRKQREERARIRREDAEMEAEEKRWEEEERDRLKAEKEAAAAKNKAKEEPSPKPDTSAKEDGTTSEAGTATDSAVLVTTEEAAAA